MTFAHNWDVYFHMINHYKKIKRAKAVVDCSSPKGYTGNPQENKSRCVPAGCPARAPRSCSPNCPRARSVCPHKAEFHQRCVSAPHKHEWKPCWKDRNDQGACGNQSQSVPPELPDCLIKSPFREYLNKPSVENGSTSGKTNTKDKTNNISEKDDEGDDDTSQKERFSVIKAATDTVNDAGCVGPCAGKGEKSNQDKTETPISVVLAPPNKFKEADKTLCGNLNLSEVKDHEYVYFLLKITEDILRNNIYNEYDMENLFESHIEANKGRLEEARMRQQIDQLRKELSVPLTKDDTCDCSDSKQEGILDCTCCPAFAADGKTNLQETCSCDNPNCPKDTILSTRAIEDIEAKFAEAVLITPSPCNICVVSIPGDVEKTSEITISERSCICDAEEVAKESETPEDTVEIEDIESRFGQAVVTEPIACGICVISSHETTNESAVPETICRCGRKVVASPEHPQVTIQTPEIIREELKPPPAETPQPEKTAAQKTASKPGKVTKTDCLDPLECRNVSPIKTLSYSSRASSAHSMFKMRALDEEDTNSQIVFYNGLEPESEHCFCTLSLQKKALKIQVDNKDEEYILVDGPVCMPRSMLETRTIPVLIQNVPSVILNTAETAAENKPSDSRVNLFQHSQAQRHDGETNLDSISGFIVPDRDGDYDMMPEREMNDGILTPSKEPESILKNESPKESNDMSKTASFYEDLVTTISSEMNSDDGKKTPPKVCGPCGSPRTKCTLRSDPSANRDGCSKLRARAASSQLFEVSTKDDGVIPPTDSVDSARKYHYLLVDVATSTTSFQPSDNSEKERSIASNTSAESPPVVAVESEESVQQQYKLLVDQEYETDETEREEETERDVEPEEEEIAEFLEDETPELLERDEELPEKKPEKSTSSLRLSETSTQDLESEVHTLFSQDKILWTEKQKQPKIFQYPTISEQMKNDSPKRTSDSMQERLSIAESYRRGSIMMPPDPEALRNLGPIESLTTPIPYQNHPPVLKQSVVNASPSGLRPHEGLKVRYSMTREFFDAQQQETLRKLEAVPTTDPNYKDNMAAINEKMREFRKVEEDNDAQRRFQITNPDHFEIRRVSVPSAHSNEDVDNSRKSDKKKGKGKCCGLGQPTKAKRTKGIVSPTDANAF